MRASAFDRNDELADHIVRYLKRRAGNVSGDNSVSIGVEGQLDARLDQWSKERRVPGRRLAYDRPGGPPMTWSDCCGDRKKARGGG